MTSQHVLYYCTYNSVSLTCTVHCRYCIYCTLYILYMFPCFPCLSYVEASSSHKHAHASFSHKHSRVHINIAGRGLKKQYPRACCKETENKPIVLEAVQQDSFDIKVLKSHHWTGRSCGPVTTDHTFGPGAGSGRSRGLDRPHPRIRSWIGPQWWTCQHRPHLWTRSLIGLNRQTRQWSELH